MSKVPTYTREDREPRDASIEGLEQLLLCAELEVLIEQYGLSVMFDPEEVEWTATDPNGYYSATANTPTGAVVWWDLKRQDIEGKDDKPKLVLVEDDDE